LIIFIEVEKSFGFRIFFLCDSNQISLFYTKSVFFSICSLFEAFWLLLSIWSLGLHLDGRSFVFFSYFVSVFFSLCTLFKLIFSLNFFCQFIAVLILFQNDGSYVGIV